MDIIKALSLSVICSSMSSIKSLDVRHNLYNQKSAHSSTTKKQKFGIEKRLKSIAFATGALVGTGLVIFLYSVILVM
jgi:hypothetical protein